MADQKPANFYNPKDLLKVANLYFKENKTQEEISQQVSYSRATVARMIRAAIEKGIVQINIVPPNELGTTYELEAHLVEKFACLKEAVVIPGHDDSLTDNLHSTIRDGLFLTLTQIAGQYLARHITNSDTVVVSPGQHVKSTIRSIKFPQPLPDLKIVPMTGYSSRRYTITAAPTNAIDLQEVSRGQYFWLPIPAFVNTGQETVAKELPIVRTALEVMQEATLVVTGIGGFNEHKKAAMIRSGFVDEAPMNAFLESVQHDPPLGEIGGRLFTANGKEIVDTPWCPIGFGLTGPYSLEDIVENQKGEVIAIAGIDRERFEPILAALRGNLINVLITDSTTAKWLLTQDAA